MCGNCVCEECSKNMRRYSKKDSKSYRTCDYCDNKIGNRQAEETFKAILKSKESIIQSYKQKIKEVNEKQLERQKRMEKLNNKYAEIEQTYKKNEEEQKMNLGKIEKMVKQLKDTKKQIEKTLCTNKQMLEDRENYLKELQSNYDQKSSMLIEEKISLENKKNEFKEYQQQYQAQKSLLGTNGSVIIN